MITQKIITHYTDYVLEHNKQPISIYNFCKNLEIEEAQFYDHFASFDQLDSYLLSKMIGNAIALTENSDEESSEPQDPKHQLLTFYLTLTEVLKSNRSLVIFLLPKSNIDLRTLKVLQKSKGSFLVFLKTLDVSLDFMSFIPDTNIQNKTIQTAAWVQFVSILKYWLNDDSHGFEKTDVFIEKSLKLSFEISDSNVLNSIIDLGKFMMNKK
ncbi:TetR family transcriptional regulator C-terminal domain-containing protein [Vicingaceae bacterium]|nr:TetR family transcriptional regulator C-terminal domain-containing protein [Vicingaceae bacterium]